ncbi:ubiquitin-conjugating enzyme E2 T-like [Thraustotheca clavata]|uniref:E2 ubiquitin-conjugating enzyme n=1 Tax=Thraustotheca clavata TaxID=74557 RepID=A0A1V9YZW2_9STRA|nr:ubiquitin-conjugating enzyme E2 T-like [Thraustotheca clavata]
MAAMRSRMRKELEMLENDPPHGVCAWTIDEKLDDLQAQIQGPEGTPYENGVFLLEIKIPERYPFEPPKVHFLTPIFHPNIDNGGRICLDTLKMQPKGSWMPSVNLSTLLTTIRLLMAEPNPDDGLMPEITDLFKQNHALFVTKAKEMTAQHATIKFKAELALKPKVLNEDESSSEDEESKESCSSSSDDDEEDNEDDEEDNEDNEEENNEEEEEEKPMYKKQRLE